MTPDAWINALYTYGPFAILVLLIFVVERKLRQAVKDAAPEARRPYIAAYMLNWAAVLGLVVVTVYVWSWLNLKEEQTVHGRLDGMPADVKLTTDSPDLYFARITLPGERSDYKWRLITPKKLAGEKIKIIVDPTKGGPGEGLIRDYKIEIGRDFYERLVRINYNARERKMFLELKDGPPKELTDEQGPLAAPAEPERTAAAWAFLVPTAHAQQSPPQWDGYARALESPDAVVRRNARAELARQGTTFLPQIEDTLARPESSYRLKLGAIVALNNMRGLNFNSLRETTIAAIKKAINDPDDALRNEARSLQRKGPPPVVIYEHYGYDGRRGEFWNVEKYRADRGQFGGLPDNSASSLRVARGYKARLCDGAGTGNGGPPCQEFGAGNHQLKGGKGSFADRASFVEVF